MTVNNDQRNGALEGDPLYTEVVESVVRLASQNEALTQYRFDLVDFAADIFFSAGKELHAIGHFIGSDRSNGASPFGHGSDETVGVSLLLRIGAQLISSSGDLFRDGRHYSAAGLVRQLVEVEYLACAIETRDRDAERWLRSTRDEREMFFTPAKLRKAADGKFRGKDYGYHCELGGHPVPSSYILLNADASLVGLLMSDFLGHIGRIWEHFVGWADRSPYGKPITARTVEMRNRFMAWKQMDPLIDLPPPP